MIQMEQLYREYFHDIYLYIKSLSHSDMIAEEITAETFLKALKSLDTFKGECDVRVWLCQIARNSYFTYLRKNKKSVPIEDLNREHTGSDVETKMINRNASQAIHHYLHDLKEPYKEVFTLRTFAELSFKEIGNLFGKSENWACVTYHRAKSKIREQMEDWI